MSFVWTRSYQLTSIKRGKGHTMWGRLMQPLATSRRSVTRPTLKCTPQMSLFGDSTRTRNRCGRLSPSQASCLRLSLRISKTIAHIHRHEVWMRCPKMELPRRYNMNRNCYSSSNSRLRSWSGWLVAVSLAHRPKVKTTSRFRPWGPKSKSNRPRRQETMVAVHLILAHLGKARLEDKSI